MVIPFGFTDDFEANAASFILMSTQKHSKYGKKRA